MLVKSIPRHLMITNLHVMGSSPGSDLIFKMIFSWYIKNRTSYDFGVYIQGIYTPKPDDVHFFLLFCKWSLIK